jgi:hypothetical protein
MFLFCLVPVLDGCLGLGPISMRYDMQQYNKDVLLSEQRMLLYNVGLLNQGLPPHFMTVATIAQTLTYSAAGAFTFTNVWNKLFAPHTSTSTNIKGSNTYGAGITASMVENPTILFVPIQGQDFAQRFESPVTDKLTLFLEDLNPGYGEQAKCGSQLPDEKELKPKIEAELKEELRQESNQMLLRGFEQEVKKRIKQSIEQTNERCSSGRIAKRTIVWLLSLFAQNLDVRHGDHDCPDDIWQKVQYPTKEIPYFRQGTTFKSCIDKVANYKDFDQVDANIPIVSATSTPKDPPTATEEVSALEANLRWAKVDNENRLATVVRIPALLDYDPIFEPEPEVNKKLSDALIPTWWEYIPKPPWKGLAYTLPPKYQWYQFKYKEPNLEADYRRLNKKYILLPEGKVLKCHGKNCKPVSRGEETPTTYQKMRGLSYGDKLVRDVWPYPYDEVYFEFRNHNATNDQAEQDCTIAPYPDKDLENMIIHACHSMQCPSKSATVDEDECDQDDAKCECELACKDRDTLQSASNKYKNDRVFCGFLKIGNLIQILQNLSDLACTDKETKSPECDDSIFGIGPKVPPYATVEAPYTNYPVSIHPDEWIWAPAHNPNYTENRNADQEKVHTQRVLGERDKFMFLELCKLYQMSLVDTSKLLTGTIPVTISK